MNNQFEDDEDWICECGDEDCDGEHEFEDDEDLPEEPEEPGFHMIWCSITTPKGPYIALCRLPMSEPRGDKSIEIWHCKVIEPTKENGDLYFDFDYHQKAILELDYANDDGIKWDGNYQPEMAIRLQLASQLGCDEKECTVTYCARKPWSSEQWFGVETEHELFLVLCKIQFKLGGSESESELTWRCRVITQSEHQLEVDKIFFDFSSEAVHRFDIPDRLNLVDEIPVRIAAFVDCDVEDVRLADDDEFDRASLN